MSQKQQEHGWTGETALERKIKEQRRRRNSEIERVRRRRGTLLNGGSPGTMAVFSQQEDRFGPTPVDEIVTS